MGHDRGRGDWTRCPWEELGKLCGPAQVAGEDPVGRGGIGKVVGRVGKGGLGKTADRESRAPIPGAGCGEQAGGEAEPELELGAELLLEKEADLKQGDWGE